MAVQLSVDVRNGKLDAVETVIGASPTLEIRTGSQPANCAAADTGTLLATITLPADWLNAAASGQKTLAGVWQGVSSIGGVAGHFRIKASGSCKLQGNCGAASSGADMELSSLTLDASQTFKVLTFTMTEANA